MEFQTVTDFDSLIESMEKSDSLHTQQVKRFFSKSNTRKRFNQVMDKVNEPKIKMAVFA